MTLKYFISYLNEKIKLIMKVTHVCTKDIDGAGLCCYRICKAQISLGMNCHLVVRHRYHSDAFIHSCASYKYLLKKIISKIDRILRLNLLKENQLIVLMRKYNAYYSTPLSVIDVSSNKYIREADVIHLHWVSGYIDYPSFFKQCLHKIIICTLHDENLFYGIAHYSKDYLANNKLEKKYYSLKKNSLRLAPNIGIVFLSKMMYDNFHDNEMIKGFPMTIINNSVDYNLYKPKDKSFCRKKYFNISENTLIVAFCASIISDKRKGLNILSEVMYRINPNYKIIAIGQTKSDDYWPNVISIGTLKNSTTMSEVLSSADYFCMPSYQEAFAQTPLEAMACGLPVVAFPCSGTEELIRKNTGVRCRDFTSQALEDGLREAFGINYSSEYIRADVIARFSPEKIAKQYIDFYKSVSARNFYEK